MFKTRAMIKNGVGENQSAEGQSGTVLFLRPNFFVGNGGTGHRILLYLKAIFLLLFGEIPAGIRLAAFDTDDENLVVSVGGRPVSLERGSEFFYIGKVPVASIIRHIDNLPTIRERLPMIRELPPLALLDGAGQNRALGLLALLWHYDTVQRVVRDTLWELTHRENLGSVGELRVDASRGLNIFQCGSLCGGTNSGQLLDQAYLIRSELERLGELADFSKVIGVGVLPDAFRNTQGLNLVPNTVAALKELNGVMVRGGFRAEYRNGHVVDSPRPPFDLYYVQGAVAEDGRTQLSRDELCRMIALGLYHLALSPIGGRQRSVFDNVTEVLTHRTADGYGTFLASFGVAELSFPADAIADWCTAQQAVRVIREGALAGPEAAEAAAEAAVQALELSVGGLVGRLAVDDTGLPLNVELQAPGWTRSLEPHQVPQQLMNWVQAFQRERVEGDYRVWVRENATRRQQHLLTELAARVHAAMDRDGLPQARALATTLGDHLEHLAVTLTARRQTLEAQRGDLEIDLEQAAGDLTRAAQAGWLARLLENPTAQATEHYLRTAQAALSAWLELMVVERAVAIAIAGHEQARALARELDALMGRLEALATHLERRADELAAEILAVAPRLGAGSAAAGAGPAGLALVDEPSLQALYQERAVAGETLLDTLLADSGQGLHAWVHRSQAQIEEVLLAAAARLFEPIREITIEAAIQAQAAQMSPQERKNLLVGMARPAWNLEETRLPHGGARLARLVLLGVPDADRSIYRGDGDRLVSTADPQRLTVFAMTAGAPVPALRSFEADLRTYEQVRDTRALHVLPGFSVDGQRLRLAFALGLVFKFIEDRQANHYYRPADPLAAEVWLGRGRPRAIETLAAHDGRAHEITERVKARIEQIGAGRALEEMDAFCQPAPRDDDLARELKRLVREYAEGLKRLPGALPVR